MSNLRLKDLIFVIAIVMTTMVFTYVYAQDQAGSPPYAGGKNNSTAIDGSYNVTLVLPARTVKNILTLCSDGGILRGSLHDADSHELMGEFFGGSFKGNEFEFNIKVGPGSLDFVGYADGKSVTGKVTISNQTSDFTGAASDKKFDCPSAK